MKNLKNYGKNNGNNANSDAFSAYEQAKRKYGNMNEDALISELKKQIEKSKKDGTFSEQKLQNQIDAMMPYLTAEQRAKLDALKRVLR